MYGVRSSPSGIRASIWPDDPLRLMVFVVQDVECVQSGPPLQHASTRRGQLMSLLGHCTAIQCRANLKGRFTFSTIPERRYGVEPVILR
jgi:hypothetical protein